MPAPCLNSDDIMPLAITCLALLSTLRLAVRARRERDTSIVAAIVPRVYIAAIFLWFSLYEYPGDFRVWFSRVGFIVLLLTENLEWLVHVGRLFRRNHLK